MTNIDTENPVIGISYSKAKCFYECKRRFMFKYIEKIPEQSNTYATRGNKIHKDIELFITNKSENPGDIHPDALSSILYYRNQYGAGSLYSEHKIERQFIIGFNEFNYCGFIDILHKNTPSEWTVIDIKTGKERDFALQLNVYAYILFLNTPDLQKINGEVLYTQTGSKYSYEFFRDETLNTFRYLEETMSDMCNEKEYTHKESWLCRFCSYKKECDAINSRGKYIHVQNVRISKELFRK